tara:strand:+ start:86262 stop:86423 length:162 start_codon:yes stop_codon:yes gene_type:complete
LRSYRASLKTERQIRLCVNSFERSKLKQFAIVSENKENRDAKFYIEKIKKVLE